MYVGDKVGLLDGGTVGLAVGCGVGVPTVYVGTKVGSNVGEEEGDAVGSGVGVRTM